MSSDDGQSLILSTWFMMSLHGDSPGGLPNDFLTRGAPAMLLFDKVICDDHALAAELRFRGQWLSADIMHALEQAGVLERRDLTAAIPQDFREHLVESGISRTVQELLGQELHKIKTNPSPLDSLKLPEALTWLNHYMFTALDVPRSVKYEWQEHHFRLRNSPEELIALLESEDTTLDQSDRTDLDDTQLAKALTTILPEFRLIPEISPRSPSAAALRKAIREEKVALYRWIYGDPNLTRDNYHDFRQSRKFRDLDTIVDSPRQALAWRNLELLLKTRAATADIRRGVQSIFSDVISGQRTVTDVEAELHRHQSELIASMPSSKAVTLDLAMAGAGFAVGLASVIGALVGLVPVGISPIGPTAGAYRLWKAKRKLDKVRELRDRYPLVWLLRDFNELQTKDWRAQTPRKRRGTR